ncbi:MAG: N-acetylmuramoyl-L-alanine amidase [Puia sp.]
MSHAKKSIGIDGDHFSLAAATIHTRRRTRVYKKETKDLSNTIREAPADYFTSQNAEWVGTVNFDLRKPNFVIIHHTAQNGCTETLHTFTIKQSQVSAHYVICKDGTVHHMLNDYLRAWQAGLSKWGNNSDINSSSIGIELDNNGFEYFTDPQIASLTDFIRYPENKI